MKSHINRMLGIYEHLHAYISSLFDWSLLLYFYKKNIFCTGILKLPVCKPKNEQLSKKISTKVGPKSFIKKIAKTCGYIFPEKAV